MLPDTLSVKGTPISSFADDRTYTRVEESLNRSTYVASTNTDTHRVWLQFLRTAAKPSGESRGSKKFAIKLTEDQSVDNASGSGEIIRPAVLTLTVSIPVGTTSTVPAKLYSQMAALLANPATITGLDSASKVYHRLWPTTEI